LQGSCLHFLRTGKCANGQACRLNHPQDRLSAAKNAGIVSEYLNNVGLPIREVRVTRRPRKVVNKSCESNGRGFGWEIALHAASVTLVDFFPHDSSAFSHKYV
jgi:hypothetical protein